MSERPTQADDTVGTPPDGDGADYRFKINAYSPQTIPMARLAEYMRELAAMLGEQTSVHFIGLETGSTVLVQRVEREAIPKVLYRAAAVRTGQAPGDASRAYRALNRLLREDDADGVLTTRASGVVLSFPGRDDFLDEAVTIKQEGSIDGELIRVGGTDEGVPILLRMEGAQIAGCFADRGVAKQLGARLFQYVRLHGTGRWRRDGDGTWSLVRFHVQTFEVLKSGGLSAAIDELRQAGVQFPPGAYDELDVIRRGATRRGDGRR